MKSDQFKRLLVAIPSLLIASLIVFTLPRLLPSNAVQPMMEEQADGKDLGRAPGGKARRVRRILVG